MTRLIKRAAVALAVLIVGLVLQASGVSAGVVVAAVGLAMLIIVGLVSPWPWQKGWRE